MNPSAQGTAIRPIYRQAEEAMRGVRSALEAELWATELVGAVRLGMGARPEEELADAISTFAAAIGEEADRTGDATALAMVRALGAVLPAPARDRLMGVGDRLVAQGVREPGWASTVGRPVIGACLRHRDAAGEQEAILVSARYGAQDHALAVLVDHVLGGGVKDSWVAGDAAVAIARFRQAGRRPGTIAESLAWPQARALLVGAVSRPDCPQLPDQIEDVALHRGLLLARLALGDGAATDPAPAGRGTAAPKKTKKPTTPATRAGRGSVLQVKVTLRGSKPPIWRRLLVASSITLGEVHGVIQAAFDWAGYHLHVFEVNGVQYGEPDPELEFRCEVGVRLTRVAPVGSKLRYTYDFGDDWEHVIEVEKSLPAQEGVSYPVCIGGRRAAPPEDCGGIWGYAQLLELLEQAPDDERAADEDGYLAMIPEGFDPAVFDVEAVNDRLAHPDEEV